MEKLKNNSNRRDFLKKCGVASLPLLAPSIAFGNTIDKKNEKTNGNELSLNFIYDDIGFSSSPTFYLKKLNEINNSDTIQYDLYGNGGDTRRLEQEFAKITGKEKAIYLPTGTMANQLAIKLLNGEKTKVIVPENSHIFRDEADAAQSVHNKRLVAIGKGKHHFDVSDLKSAVNYINDSEVFKSGIGTVVIENPIRRADGRYVPIETIKKISNYCKGKGYKLHLDGARIHIASAYSGVSVTEYASYFDTVYISLYKYLNASGGAILCGDAKLINQVAHQIKIHGGTMFQSWNNTSMALHYLNGIEKRWKVLVDAGNKLITGLNTIKGVSIKKLNEGSNIYDLKFDTNIDFKKIRHSLYKNHNIRIGGKNRNGIVKFAINEGLLSRNIEGIIAVWKKEIGKL